MEPDSTVLVANALTTQPPIKQSCKSGQAFRVGFGSKVNKNFGLNSGLRRTFCLRCTKI